MQINQYHTPETFLSLPIALQIVDLVHNSLSQLEQ